MDADVQLILSAFVGLSSGAIGAVAGAWAQRRLDDRAEQRQRITALALLERAYRIQGQRWTDERPGRDRQEIVTAAEQGSISYFHTLPPGLREALDSEPWLNRPGVELFELGEDYLAKAAALRAYLESS